MSEERASCARPACGSTVDKWGADTVVVPHRLSPHTQTYYHSGCYDPWAETTKAEDRAAMGIGPLDEPEASPLAEPLTSLFDEIGAMMEGRHAKYGPGNIAEFGDLGILVRMGDKFARLKSGFQDFSDETVHDTLDDIIGYALIWKMWLNGDWPGSDSSGSVTMATKPQGIK